MVVNGLYLGVINIYVWNGENGNRLILGELSQWRILAVSGLQICWAEKFPGVYFPSVLKKKKKIF